jgi:hypothetical protein
MRKREGWGRNLGVIFEPGKNDGSGLVTTVANSIHEAENRTAGISVGSVERVYKIYA